MTAHGSVEPQGKRKKKKKRPKTCATSGIELYHS
jgi:hypothetical protein